MVEETELLNIYKETGALLDGHFQLTSGLHSDQYFQCALVLQYPEYCELLANNLKEKLADVDKPNLIIGPALGGVTLAYELARSFRVKGVFAERKEGRMQMRRGFHLDESSKVIVIEDVVTTGKSVKEVIEVVKGAGAQILAVGSIVDRSPSAIDFGVPFHSLMKMKVNAYEPSQCPLCRKKVPISKPGSRPQQN